MSRRAVLRLAGGVALGLAGSSVVGCGSPEPAEPSVTRVSLDRLPDGGRLEIEHLGERVQLVRTGEGIEARSLVCPHTGCAVQWKPEDDRYWCPCHDGVFDRDGRVVAGPPPRDLRLLPVRIEGREVIVGEAPRDGETG